MIEYIYIPKRFRESIIDKRFAEEEAKLHHFFFKYAGISAIPMIILPLFSLMIVESISMFLTALVATGVVSASLTLFVGASKKEKRLSERDKKVALSGYDKLPKEVIESYESSGNYYRTLTPFKEWDNMFEVIDK